jgi:hypothetical protein
MSCKQEDYWDDNKFISKQKKIGTVVICTNPMDAWMATCYETAAKLLRNPKKRKKQL